MAIPASVVGSTTLPVTVTVERGRLALFAKATGQHDKVYTDVTYAQAEGHRDLPVPPTFLFGLELEQPDPFAWIADLGVDLNHVLHGSQSFEYEQLAYAGDTLTAQSTVTDLYSKKGGALEFLERQTTVTRDDQKVATLTQVLVVRNPS
ncbi:MAG: MaoC family dehydratase N-terminal domain-containing protein [Actinomycetota bacterium]|nr:MaoC family dehydratase N-terminal domain-containing protein [Actinomycetota bacterium]